MVSETWRARRATVIFLWVFAPRPSQACGTWAQSPWFLKRHSDTYGLNNKRKCRWLKLPRWGEACHFLFHTACKLPEHMVLLSVDVHLLLILFQGAILCMYSCENFWADTPIGLIGIEFLVLAGRIVRSCQNFETQLRFPGFRNAYAFLSQLSALKACRHTRRWLSCTERWRSFPSSSSKANAFNFGLFGTWLLIKAHAFTLLTHSLHASLCSQTRPG